MIGENPLLLGLMAVLFIINIDDSQAQDFEDFEDSFGEDLLITGDEADAGGGASFTDYIVGDFGVRRAENDAVERSITTYNIGLDVPFAIGRFYLTYGGLDSEININQTLREPDATQVNQGRSLNRTVTTKTDIAGVREAFIQLKLGSSITVSAGRQRNAWGQFELFSPAAILQPFNSNSTSLLPSKLEFLQPQDQVQISIFPTSRIELSLYSMSSLRTDEGAENNLAKFLHPFYSVTDDGALFFAEDADATIEPKIVEFNKPDKPQQSAVRLAFYPDWGTVAFTHHKGYDTATPLLNTGVGAFYQEGFCIAFDMQNACTNMIESGYDTVASGYSNPEDSYLYYPEATLNAFEISVPTGKLTWRYEMAVVESVSPLDPRSSHLILYKPPFEPGFTEALVTEFTDAAYASTRDATIRGTGLYQSEVTTNALGVQYQGAIWTLDMTYISIGVPEPVTADGKRLLAAYDALEAEAFKDDTFEDPTYSLPLLTVLRKSGEDNQHSYAMTVGTVEVGVGVGLFYTYNLTENLSLGVSANNFKINRDATSDRYYKTKEAATTTQTSLAWRF